MTPIFIRLILAKLEGEASILTLNSKTIEGIRRWGNITSLWTINSKHDDHYEIIETPEQILELINQAIEKQPKLATEEHLTRIEAILREKWGKQNE